MRKTIKASLINGNLVPLEPCDLNDGDEVLVQVHVANGATPKPSTEQPDSVNKSIEPNGKPGENEPSSPKGHSILARVEAIKANLRDFEQPDEMPADAAKNYKHYMYGGPKESDR